VKRHLITFAFLALAIACYRLGATVPGTFLLLLGALAEITFWMRLSGKGRKTPRTH